MTTFGGGGDGFDFFIRIRDEFSKTTASLRQELDLLAKEFRQIQNEAQGQRVDSRSSAAAMRELAEATRSVVKATDKAAGSSRRRRRRMTNERAAALKLARAKRELAVSDKLREKATGESAAIRERLGLLTIEERAQRKAAKAKEDLAIKERSNQILQEQGISKSKRTTEQLSVEAQARRATAKAIERQAVEQRKANLLSAQGLDSSGRPVVTGPVDINRLAREKLEKQRQDLRVEERLIGLKKLDGDYQKLDRSVGRLKRSQVSLNRVFQETEGRINRISFTFRRLFGILAAFAAARLAIAGFFGLIKGAIEFNKNLEQARLGIASILTAVSEIRDPLGGILDPVQKLPEALRIAEDQVAKLRIEATRTVSTFDQLVETFQTAIAPGVQAGGSLEQIRQFAVQISQAAAAIGLQQNQLAEEIRSIFEGTITRRTTRIATALGITNDDIDRWKEAGVLFDRLGERFQAFTTAGGLAAQTFQGVLTNTFDALRLVLGEAGTGLFDNLKGLLNDFRGALVDTETLQLDPQAVQVASALLQGLERAAIAAREVRDNITFEDALAGAKGIGDALGLAAEGLAGVIEGVITGFRNAFPIIRATLNEIGKLLGLELDDKSFREVASLLTHILVTVIGVQTSLFLVRKVIFTFLTPLIAVFNIAARVKDSFVVLSAVVAKMQTTFGGLLRAIFKVGLKLFLWVAIFQEVFALLTGTELRFGTLVKIVTGSLVPALRGVITLIKVGFTNAVDVVQGAFRTLAIGILKIFRVVITGITKALERLGALEDGSADAVFNRFEDRIGKISKGLKENVDDVLNSKKQIEEALGQIEQAGINLVEAIDENETADTLEQVLTKGFEQTREKFKGLFSPEVEPELGDSVSESDDLKDSLGELPGIVGRTNEALQVSGEILKRIADDTEQVRAKLEALAELGGGLTQGAGQQAFRDEVNARLKLNQDEREIRGQIAATEKSVLDLSVQLNQLKKENNALDAQQGPGNRGIRIVRRLVELENERRTLALEESILRTRAADKAGKLAGEERDALLKKADLKKAELQDLQEVLSLQERSLEALRTVADFAGQSEQFDTAVKGWKEIVLLGARLLVLRQEQKVQQDSLLDLERRSIELSTERQRALLEESRIRRQLQNDLTIVEAIEGRVLTRLRQKRQFQAADLVQEIAKTNQLKLRLRATIDEQKRTEEFFRKKRADAVRTKADDNTKARIDLQEFEIQEALTAQRAKQSAELEEQIRLEKEKIRIATGTLDQGFGEGFRKFAEDFGTQFEAGIDIAKSIITEFSSFAAQSITSAIVAGFTDEEFDFSQAAAQFAQGLATSILQKVIEANIAGLLGEEVNKGLEESRKALDGAEAAGSAGDALDGAAEGQGVVAASTTLTEAGAAAGTSITTAATTLAQTLQGAVGAIQQALSTGAASLGKAAAAFTPAAGGLEGAAISLDAAALAILKAAKELAAAGVAAGVGGAAGGASGSAAGGKVPSLSSVPRRSGPRASGLHYSGAARSFSKGGGAFNRPSWVPKSDTVPAWLTPGEWVMRTSAVRSYGDQVMAALNRGLIDPMLLKGLAGSSPVRATRPPRRPAFAAGGSVGDTRRTAATRRTSDDEVAPMPVLPIDGDLMDQVTAGGGSSLIRHARENRDEWRAALGVSRGGF